MKTNMLLRLNFWLLLPAIGLTVIPQLARAQNSPQALSLQGRLLDSQGNAVEAAAVSFSIQVRSPGTEDCLLYEESHTLNMTDSAGLFSLSIGAGTRAGNSFKDVSSLNQIFNNSAPALTGLACASGTTYTPASGQKRKIKISFDDGTGLQAFAQTIDIQTVPYSLYADSLQGKGPTDFIQKNASSSALTQANLESVFQSNANVTELLALIGGTSSKFTKASASGASNVPVLSSAPSTPAAGNLWLDSTSHALKYYDGSAVQSVGASGGSVSSVSSVDSYITVANGTSTPQLALNVGTAANTVAAGNDARITGAFQSSTALGGDLSGTLPNPVVTKIQSRSVASTTPSSSSHVLKFDGSSQWRPAYINISDLRSSVGPSYSQFFPTNCTSAQTMIYNSPTDTMVCTNVSIPNTSVTGLGSAATLDVGTSNNNIVQLDSTGKLPAVDGSQLINLPGGVSFPLFSTSNGSATTPAYSFSGDPDNGMYRAATDQLGFSTGGVERLRIDSSGYIGIGTASPLFPLHVGSSAGPTQSAEFEGPIIVRNNSSGYPTNLTLSNLNGLANSGASVDFVGLNSGSTLKNAARISGFLSNQTGGSEMGVLAFHTSSAGTPSERMRIDSSGYVGIGTTGPIAPFHLVRTSGNADAMITAEAGNAELLLTGSSGSSYPGVAMSYVNANGDLQFTRVTNGSPSSYPWITANGATGLYSFTAITGSSTELQMSLQRGNGLSAVASGTPMARISFDGYNGSGYSSSAAAIQGMAAQNFSTSYNGAHLLFLTTATGSNAPTERMRIDQSGNVGIGITSPIERLEVAGNIKVMGTTTCILGNGSGSTLCSSDENLKTNITPIENALEKILSLKGVTFDWNEKAPAPGTHAMGVIAQDIEKVFPTAVATDSATGYKMVDYAVLVAPLIQSTKELNAKVEMLEREKIEKEREVLDLKARLERLETKLDAALAK